MVTLAAASVVVVSLVSSVGMLMLAREQGRTKGGAVESEENRRLASESFTRAEQNFHQARDMLDQFGVRLADQLAGTPGTEPMQRQLLADTDRYYDQFIAQAAGDPKLRHESAVAQFKSRRDRGEARRPGGCGEQVSAHSHNWRISRPTNRKTRCCSRR